MPNEVEFRIRHTTESWDDVVDMKPIMTYAIAEQQVTDFTLTMLCRKMFNRWQMDELRWNYRGSSQGHYINKDASIIVQQLPAHMAAEGFTDWDMMMLLYSAHLYLIHEHNIDDLARQFEINQMSFETLRDIIHNLFQFYPELEGNYLKAE